jgi:hypothetical protein
MRSIARRRHTASVHAGAERALLLPLAHVAFVTSARGARAARLVLVTAACALLGSACGLDFDKYTPQGGGADGATPEQDAATGGDATSGDSGTPADAGIDVPVPADTGADVGIDASELPEASIPEASLPDASEASVTDYTVGGTITGLVGHGLQLTNSGNTVNPASGATTFTFPAQPDGSAYAVKVATQPGAPSQSCAVMNGSGNVAGANVTNVVVTCTPSCAPACNDGQMCVDGTDCASRVCTTGKCQAPACAPNCMPGTPCGANGDCKSGMCNFNHTCK